MGKVKVTFFIKRKEKTWSIFKSTLITLFFMLFMSILVKKFENF